MKRLLFFFAFMSIGSGLFYWIFWSGPSPVEHLAPVEEDFRDRLDLKVVAVRHLDGERISWELWAEHAVYNEDADSAALDIVRFNIYETEPGAARRTIMHGRSRAAYLKGGPGNLVLEKEVEIFKGEEMELRGERIEYDRQKQLLISPVPVWIKARESFHEGDTMRYSIPDDNMTFTRPVFYQ